MSVEGVIWFLLGASKWVLRKLRRWVWWGVGVRVTAGRGDRAVDGGFGSGIGGGGGEGGLLGLSIGGSFFLNAICEKEEDHGNPTLTNKLRK